MSQETKVLGIILLLTAALIGGALFFLGKSPKTTIDERIYVIDYSLGEKIGSDSAKVKLVEFSDLQCPACAAAEAFIKDTLKSSTSDVQFIYRHFPLPQHAYGRQAAEFAEEARVEGKFWEVHDKLFETQDQWSSLNETDVKEYFARMAADFGMDPVKVKEAIETEKYKDIINTDIATGQALGVNSTPTFFLNARKLNLTNFADIKTAVSQELQKR